MARISLNPTRRILFSERNEGTPASGVEALVSGARNVSALPKGAEFLKQVKQLIRTEIGSPTASLQYRNPFLDYVTNSE